MMPYHSTQKEDTAQNDVACLTRRYSLSPKDSAAFTYVVTGGVYWPRHRTAIDSRSAGPYQHDNGGEATHAAAIQA